MLDVRRPIARLGRNVINGIWRVGSMARFFALVLASSGTSFGRFRLVMREVYFSGVLSLVIIIVSGLFSRHVQSLPLNTLHAITLSERPNGSGTITFGNNLLVGQWTNSIFTRSSRTVASPAFTMIENARAVHDLIQRAQMQRTAADERWNAA